MYFSDFSSEQVHDLAFIWLYSHQSVINKTVDSVIIDELAESLETHFSLESTIDSGDKHDLLSLAADEMHNVVYDAELRLNRLAVRIQSWKGSHKKGFMHYITALQKSGFDVPQYQALLERVKLSHVH